MHVQRRARHRGVAMALVSARVTGLQHRCLRRSPTSARLDSRIGARIGWVLPLCLTCEGLDGAEPLLRLPMPCEDPALLDLFGCWDPGGPAASVRAQPRVVKSPEGACHAEQAAEGGDERKLREGKEKGTECELRRKSNEEACGPSTRRAATLRRGMGRDGTEGTTAFGSDTGSP